MHAVVRLDHHQEIPEQLLVRNHNGPACLANIYAIRTWLDVGQEPEWGDYDFGTAPGIHAAPPYHPVGNPPTQLPPAPQNLVASVLEWENVTPTPTLWPARGRRATPYPARPPASTPPVLCLPWYGIGGVPPLVAPGLGASTVEESEDGVPEDTATAGGGAEEEVHEVAALDATRSVGGPETGKNVDPTEGLASLQIGSPILFTAAEDTEPEHMSRARKRRARRKRAKDTANKLRRSQRHQEKEEGGFELPEDKAARVQRAKFDFSGASRRLRNSLSRSYIISHDFSLSDDADSLMDIAAACGASEEECAGIAGEAAGPSAGN